MNEPIKIKYKGDLTPARFQGIRQLLRISVKELSRKTGLPEKYIQEIELGIAGPPERHVKILLDAMGVQTKSYVMRFNYFEYRNALGLD